jgi:hypothetical protein
LVFDGLRVVLVSMPNMRFFLEVLLVRWVLRVSFKSCPLLKWRNGGNRRGYCY